MLRKYVLHDRCASCSGLEWDKPESCEPLSIVDLLHTCHGLSKSFCHSAEPPETRFISPRFWSTRAPRNILNIQDLCTITTKIQKYSKRWLSTIRNSTSILLPRDDRYMLYGSELKYARNAFPRVSRANASSNKRVFSIGRERVYVLWRICIIVAVNGFI